MIDEKTIAAEAWTIIRRMNDGKALEGDTARLAELQASCPCNNARDVRDFTRDGDQCENCGKYL